MVVINKIIIHIIIEWFLLALIVNVSNVVFGLQY